MTFRDFTNITKLEKKVDETSKTLKILHGVSHEMKTPLNSIINSQIQLLNEKSSFSNAELSKLSKSLNMSKHLLSLIRDMIDYSYIKTNNFAVTPNFINLNEIVNECIEIVKNFENSPCILLENKNDSISVFADGSRIRQVLLSLLSISLG